MNKDKKKDYYPPQITMLRCEGMAIMAGSITGSLPGDGFYEWAAKEYDYYPDEEDDGGNRKVVVPTDIWGDDD